MTVVFIGIGIISFIAIGFRFVSKMSSKEPAASRVK